MQRGLGGHISGKAGVRLGRGEAADQHDPAVALRAHGNERGTQAVVGGVQVLIDQPPPLLLRELVQRAEGKASNGVHHAVDLAEALDHGAHSRGSTGRGSQIGGDGEKLGMALHRLTAFARCAYDREFAPQQVLHDLAAHFSGRAGDQNHLPLHSILQLNSTLNMGARVPRRVFRR
jgi:hypothetical protein